MTDVTGLGATNVSTIPEGVQAGIGLAATEGYHIKYVLADTGTTTTGALDAARS